MLWKSCYALGRIGIAHRFVLFLLFDEICHRHHRLGRSFGFQKLSRLKGRTGKYLARWSACQSRAALTSDTHPCCGVCQSVCAVHSREKVCLVQCDLNLKLKAIWLHLCLYKPLRSSRASTEQPWATLNLRNISYLTFTSHCREGSLPRTFTRAYWYFILT